MARCDFLQRGDALGTATSLGQQTPGGLEMGKIDTFMTQTVLSAAVLLGTVMAVLLPASALAGFTYNESVTVGSGANAVTRYFHRYEPVGVPANSPLVIVLHGGGGNAYKSPRSWGNIWQSEADSGKFHVAFPEGQLQPGETAGPDARRSWNDCRGFQDTPGDGGIKPSSKLYHLREDDVAFIDQVINWFATNENINTSKVYVTGGSNGGGLVLRLARELTDHFRGFAPAIAAAPVKDDCANPSPSTLQAGGRTMFILYGNQDKLRPPAGGCSITDPQCESGEVKSINDTVAMWQNWFNTNAVTAYAPKSNPVLDDGPSRQYQRNFQHQGIEKMRQIGVQGGGHTIPGPIPLENPAWIALLGQRNQDHYHAETLADYWGIN